MLRPSLLPAILPRPLVRPRLAVRLPDLPRVSAATLRGAAFLAVPLLGYLALGLVFSLGAQIITGDAWSRVGNAYYMLFSRDPHLAAIGFVWNPLPSLVDALFLPLALIWRPIVDHGVAGNLMSALFMALAVREVWRWLAELGTTRPARIGLTLAFALHPLIVLYGGNGMSEAPFLFFLLLAGRSVSAWTRTGSVSRLAVGGFGLALAYLTRYEAVAPIAALAIVTAGIAYLRARGSRRQRALAGLADGMIVGVPAFTAFVLWALASWLIVGSPFDTFTSVYGNSSQVGLSLEAIRASTGATFGGAMAYLVAQVGALEPFLPLIVLGSVVAAIARRDLRILVPLATFGSVLAFSGALFLAGGSFGWLRFSITAIPLAVICLGVALGRNAPVVATAAPERVPSATTAVAAARFRALSASVITGRPVEIGAPSAGAMPPLPSTPETDAISGELLVRSAARDMAGFAVAALSTIVVGLALIGIPAGVNASFDSRIAREEAPKLAGLIAGDAVMPGERRQFLVAGDLARYLDAQDLPRGSVVVDVALGFWIVLQSDRPSQFVITPDRDFERTVADPAAFNATYLIVSPPAGLGGLGALERAHPGLYETGAGIATLVATFGDAQRTGVAWRLYRVNPAHG